MIPAFVIRWLRRPKDITLTTAIWEFTLVVRVVTWTRGYYLFAIFREDQDRQVIRVLIDMPRFSDVDWWKNTWPTFRGFPVEWVVMSEPV